MSEYTHPRKSEYESDISIDLFSLHREWESQPLLRVKWGEAHAEAIYEKRQARNDRRVVKSEVEMEVRRDPDAFGLIKITEGAVAAAVVLDKRVQAAEQRINEAERDERMLYAATQAMDDKKYALEWEVKLHLAGYYVKQGVPEVIKEAERAIVRSQSQKELDKKMKRRKG